MGSPFEREQENRFTYSLEYSLNGAQQCMQKVCEAAGSLGRDEDEVECGLLSRDSVSRNLFEEVLPQIRSLQAQGGTEGGIWNEWMSALGVLLTSKERATYGIPSLDL